MIWQDDAVDASEQECLTHCDTMPQLDTAFDAQDTSCHAGISHICHDVYTWQDSMHRITTGSWTWCISHVWHDVGVVTTVKLATGILVEDCSWPTWSTATSKDASEVYARLMGVPPASVLPSLQPETKSYSATRPDTLCEHTRPHYW